MKFTYASGDQPIPGYTIKRGVGRGGFGEVYYATSHGGKEVALKLVQRHLDVELRGVRHCLNLKHPNLVTLYDVIQEDTGDCWVVMEYVAGQRLEEVIASNPQGLSAEEILKWMRGICQAVDHLHSRALVHRDLKPGNVFVEDGTIKLGDYGLSKYITTSRRSGQTESVGTVHYMAPEVANGRYGKEVDIYALGIMLYEMITGAVPFQGESVGEILMKHLTAEPDLAKIPEKYREVVRRSLHKDPAKRLHSVLDILLLLEGKNLDFPFLKETAPHPEAEAGRTGTGSAAPDFAENLHKVAKNLRDSAPSFGRTIKHTIRILFAIVAVMFAMVLLPFRFVLGMIVGAPRPTKTARQLAEDVRSNPATLVKVIGVFVSLLLSVGLGLLTGGLTMALRFDEEAAVGLGLGAGFGLCGMILRKFFFRNLGTLPLPGTVVVALCSSLILGFAAGSLTVGLTMAILDSWRHFDTAMVFGVGTGLLVCGGNLFQMIKNATWQRARTLGLTPWVGRMLTALMLAVGLGFATGGSLLAFFSRTSEETVTLLAVGVGLLHSGWLVRGIFKSLDQVIQPKASLFLGAFSSLALGGGIGCAIASFCLLMMGWSGDDVAILTGIGAGLLTGGIAGITCFRGNGRLTGIGQFGFRFLLTAALGGGAGLLSAAVVHETFRAADEVAALVGVGVGLLCFGFLSTRFLLKHAAQSIGTIQQ